MTWFRGLVRKRAFDTVLGWAGYGRAYSEGGTVPATPTIEQQVAKRSGIVAEAASSDTVATQLGKGKEAECGATANRDLPFVLRRLETMLEPKNEDELGAESGTDEQDAAMSPPEAEEIGNRVESKLTQQVWTEAERGEAKLAGVKARVAAAFGQRHGEPADWASGAVRLFVAQLEPSKAQADTQAIELEADQAEEATDRRKRATEKARAIAELEAAQALEDTLSQAVSEQTSRAQSTGLGSEGKKSDDETTRVRLMIDVDGLSRHCQVNENSVGSPPR